MSRRRIDKNTFFLFRISYDISCLIYLLCVIDNTIRLEDRNMASKNATGKNTKNNLDNTRTVSYFGRGERA